MTADEIIQRLLDEKHITVSEAMILIKSIVSEFVVPKITRTIPDDTFTSPIVMYGVGVDSFPTTTTQITVYPKEEINTSFSTDDIEFDATDVIHMNISNN